VGLQWDLAVELDPPGVVVACARGMALSFRRLRAKARVLRRLGAKTMPKRLFPLGKVGLMADR
jgi:hypothetical protein